MLSLFRYIQRPRSIYSYSRAELKHEHHKRANHKHSSLHQSGGGEYMGDFVFGGIDGVVTTFAIVAGVVGADLSPNVILILGLANLWADGFSMGVGNYLSIRSERERYHHIWDEESYEIETIPEEERKEIRDIYKEKGLAGDTLDKTVAAVTENKDRWIREMLHEEHGISTELRSPFWGAATTLLAFITVGLVPLMPFGIAQFIPAIDPYTFPISIGLTAMALFGTGAMKSLVIIRPVWKAGVETLLMGGLAASVAYFVGYFLKNIA